MLDVALVVDFITVILRRMARVYLRYLVDIYSFNAWFCGKISGLAWCYQHHENPSPPLPFWEVRWLIQSLPQLRLILLVNALIDSSCRVLPTPKTRNDIGSAAAIVDKKPLCLQSGLQQITQNRVDVLIAKTRTRDASRLRLDVQEKRGTHRSIGNAIPNKQPQHIPRTKSRGVRINMHRAYVSCAENVPSGKQAVSVKNAILRLLLIEKNVHRRVLSKEYVQFA